MRIFILFFSMVFINLSMACADQFETQRESMVEGQILARGVKDTGVIEAMKKVPRHVFIPQHMQRFAYMDMPLPIGQGQTISQPYIVAYMTEALRLKKSDKVLEIGTGSGYQAAILAELAEEVCTIEIIPELGESAEKRLTDLGYANIKVRIGDGYLGWEEEAPFDAIIVTAAPAEIPAGLVEQLKVGGRMVVPVGEAFQNLYLVTKEEDGVKKEKLLPVRFVPMLHRRN